jgi:hypothetical protein
MQSKLRFILFAMGVLLGFAGTARAEVPSGERQLGQTIIEPGYDDRTGNLIYIMTPIGAPFPSHANGHAVSELYLIVYPHSAGPFVGAMSCAHEGGDNCADHGPFFADLAQAEEPDVYGNGVWGHDHMIDGVGGSEFNVAWEIVVVLFTNAQAANTHITTEAQLRDALAAGVARTIETGVVFNCNLVSAATYYRATPLPLAAD